MATALALVENYVVGWLLHFVYLPHTHHHDVADPVAREIAAHVGFSPVGGSHAHEAAAGEHELSPWLHFLRDTTLAAPVAVVVMLAATVVGYALVRRFGLPVESIRARVAFAVAAAIAAAAASVPEVLAHGWLFDEKVAGVSMGAHITGIALITLRYTFALTLVAALAFGAPWRRTTSGETP